MFNDWFSSMAAYSPSLWLLAAIGIYLTGITKSGFAGSMGVVAVPLMSIVMDPKLAAALLLPLLLFMDTLNVKAYWQDYDKSTFKSLVVGILIGICLGMALFSIINALHLKLLVGVLSILFAVRQLHLRYSTRPKVNHVKGMNPGFTSSIGAVSGLTSFVAHAGGAPLTLLFLKSGLSKQAILATSAVTIGFMNLVKLPAYAALGILNLNVGLFSVVLMPLAWLGIRSGLWIKDYVSETLFTDIMTYGLLTVGLYLSISSLCGG